MLAPFQQDGSSEPSPLVAEEIVERLTDSWMLQLNIDPRTNVDDQGRDLGYTAWHMVARCFAEEDSEPAVADIIAVADCIENAEAVAVKAVAESPEAPGRPSNGWLEVQLPICDRITPKHAAEMLGKSEEVNLDAEAILRVAWSAAPKP